MIVDYFFDARLWEKYDKIAEEKFGSKFICYALQYKEEFEEYDKNLKNFQIFILARRRSTHIFMEYYCRF